MPRSMTGFGRGECIRYDRRFKVEIKSVNHRYNDITIKLPRFLNPFEDRIKKRLSAEIARGKVDVWINFESFTQKDVSVKINEAFADAYMGAMSDIVARYKLGDSIPAATGLELLVRNSDIISFDKFETAVNSDTAQTEMLEALDEALELALAQFSKMRKAEGDALAQDILEKQKLIMGLRAQLAVRAPLVVEEHAAKLRARLTDALEKVGHQPDEGRFLTEIALIADRSTIDEELIRLDSHLSQLATMLNEKNAIGRKLDFLVQEMNREANTIGSKSADAELSKLVVELKSEIEKIREQVQNIE